MNKRPDFEPPRNMWLEINPMTRMNTFSFEFIQKCLFEIYFELLIFSGCAAGDLAGPVVVALCFDKFLLGDFNSPGFAP